MSSPLLHRPMSWAARIAVCLPLVALALVAGPAEAAQPAEGTAGSGAGRSPAGQSTDDTNRGRDCDANPGAGDGNPAFAACAPAVEGEKEDTDADPVNDPGHDADADTLNGAGDASGSSTGSDGDEVLNSDEATGTADTSAGTNGDIVTGGTPSDVVVTGSGADEVGISWIVISKPIVEVLTPGDRLAMTNPITEFALALSVTPAVTPPVAAAPGLELPAAAPVAPDGTAPGAPGSSAQVSAAVSQTGSSSSSATRSQSSTSAAAPAALPFTGFGTGQLLLLAAGLALAGLMLTLAGRRPRTS